MTASSSVRNVFTGKRSPKIILLFGPTAVGKTRLIFELFDSGFEIINADSMQVYRGMDIGTAKPSAEQRQAIPHHLIDIRDPDEQYTVGDFVRDANDAVAQVTARGRIPILSGGTAFYFRNFIYGLPKTPPSDPGIRDTLRSRLAEEGSEALHQELAAVDPAAALRIAANDGYRITRALEVYQLTGRGLSDYTVSQKPRQDAEVLTIGLYRDRAHLHRRIEERTEAMFEAGLPQEVARLRESGYGSEDPGMRAIGYREFFVHSSIEEVKRRITISSRQYAKRQMTFFRSLPGVEWLSPAQVHTIARLVERFLS